MLEYALVAGITASGADAYILHVTTTTSVSYVVRTEGFDCGVMISASHNAYYDNGIKLLSGSGEKMDDGLLEQIEQYLDGADELPFAQGENIGVAVDHVSGRNRYVGYLISLGMFSFKGMRIGLDCANGAAWNIARTVFEALGAKTYMLGTEPDGLNINRDCGSTHIEKLQELVLKEHLDAGFAFDGDADRCLCVDEKGNVVTGDHILYILGRYMKDRGQLDNNTVVTTVMSNFGLYKAFEQAGIDYAKTQVGDKYVYEYMAQHSCRLGGEQSGHIIISKYANTGDGLLTSIKVMEVMLSQKKTLGELAGEMQFYPQYMVNVPVQDKDRAMSDPKVAEAIRQAELELGDSGRVLVRPSGTEPVVRVMAECQSEQLCKTVVERIAREMKV
jgi:phosphoglucosamine mutase